MKDNRLERIQQMAERFHQTGTIDKVTMRQVNALTDQAKPLQMSAEDIRSLRIREGISQGVLATILNMSSESVQKWEQGKSKPQGAALRLLSIIQRNGVKAVI